MTVHLVVGGFPPGQRAGHDMDAVRLRLLQYLSDAGAAATVSGDFADLERWLPVSRALVTYTAGPHPDGAALGALDAWLAGGGRWFALHGTAGGRAAPLGDGTRARRMVRTGHHDTLGAYFLNHPPIRRFRVDVVPGARDLDRHGERLLRDVPDAFEVDDELYLVEVRGAGTRVLLRTDLPDDPTPPGFGFAVPEDTSLLADGRSRALGTLRLVPRAGVGPDDGPDDEPGGVAYVALGHRHDPATNIQPFVDGSLGTDGTTPLGFAGPWDTPGFEQLVRNGIAWSLGRP
jgi:hypothetical protein